MAATNFSGVVQRLAAAAQYSTTPLAAVQHLLRLAPPSSAESTSSSGHAQPISSSQQQAALAVLQYYIATHGRNAARLSPVIAAWLRRLPQQSPAVGNEAFSHALTASALLAVFEVSYRRELIQHALVSAIERFTLQARTMEALDSAVGSRGNLSPREVQKTALPALAGMLRAFAEYSRGPLPFNAQQLARIKTVLLYLSRRVQSAAEGGAVEGKADLLSPAATAASAISETGDSAPAFTAVLMHALAGALTGADFEAGASPLPAMSQSLQLRNRSGSLGILPSQPSLESKTSLELPLSVDEVDGGSPELGNRAISPPSVPTGQHAETANPPPVPSTPSLLRNRMLSADAITSMSAWGGSGSTDLGELAATVSLHVGKGQPMVQSIESQAGIMAVAMAERGLESSHVEVRVASARLLVTASRLMVGLEAKTHALLLDELVSAANDASASELLLESLARAVVELCLRFPQPSALLQAGLAQGHPEAAALLQALSLAASSAGPGAAASVRIPCNIERTRASVAALTSLLAPVASAFAPSSSGTKRSSAVRASGGGRHAAVSTHQRTSRMGRNFRSRRSGGVLRPNGGAAAVSSLLAPTSSFAFDGASAGGLSENEASMNARSAILSVGSASSLFAAAPRSDTGRILPLDGIATQSALPVLMPLHPCRQTLLTALAAIGAMEVAELDDSPSSAPSPSQASGKLSTGAPDGQTEKQEAPLGIAFSVLKAASALAATVSPAHTGRGHGLNSRRGSHLPPTSDSSGAIAGTSQRKLGLNSSESIPMVDTVAKLVQQARQGIDAVLNASGSGGKLLRQMSATGAEVSDKETASASTAGMIARRCVAFAGALAAGMSALETVSVLSTSLDFKPLVRQSGAHLLSLYTQLADGSSADPMWLRVSTLCGPGVTSTAVASEAASLAALQASVYGSYRRFVCQLLFALVDTALLSARLYPSVVSALTTRFEQPPGSDPLRLGVTVRDIPAALARLAAGMQATPAKREALRSDLRKRMLRLASKVGQQDMAEHMSACVAALRAAGSSPMGTPLVPSCSEESLISGTAAALATKAVFTHASQQDVPLHAHLMARLLPALSFSAASCDETQPPSQEDVSAFRIVWSIVTLSGVTAPGVWSADTSKALQAFAAHSPTLQVPGDAAYLVTRISSASEPLLLAQASAERSSRLLVSAMEKGSMTPQAAVASAAESKAVQGSPASRAVLRLQASLTNALPGCAAALQALSTPLLLFTATVLHLELLRTTESGCAEHAFSYVDSPALQLGRASRFVQLAPWLEQALGTVGTPQGPTPSEIAPGATLLGPPADQQESLDALGAVFSGVANCVLTAALRLAHSRMASAGGFEREHGAQEDVLVPLMRTCMLLLSCAASRSRLVRAAALAGLRHARQTMPQLTWDAQLLRAMMGTTEALSARAVQGMSPLAPHAHSLGYAPGYAAQRAGAATAVLDAGSRGSGGAVDVALGSAAVRGRHTAAVDAVSFVGQGSRVARGMADSGPLHIAGGSEVAPLSVPGLEFPVHCPSEQGELTSITVTLAELTAEWIATAVGHGSAPRIAHVLSTQLARFAGVMDSVASAQRKAGFASTELNQRSSLNDSVLETVYPPPAGVLAALAVAAPTAASSGVALVTPLRGPADIPTSSGIADAARRVVAALGGAAGEQGDAALGATATATAWSTALVAATRADAGGDRYGDAVSNATMATLSALFAAPTLGPGGAIGAGGSRHPLSLVPGVLPLAGAGGLVHSTGDQTASVNLLGGGVGLSTVSNLQRRAFFLGQIQGMVAHHNRLRTKLVRASAKQYAATAGAEASSVPVLRTAEHAIATELVAQGDELLMAASRRWEAERQGWAQRGKLEQAVAATAAPASAPQEPSRRELAGMVAELWEKRTAAGKAGLRPSAGRRRARSGSDTSDISGSEASAAMALRSSLSEELGGSLLKPEKGAQQDGEGMGSVNDAQRRSSVLRLLPAIVRLAVAGWRYASRVRARMAAEFERLVIAHTNTCAAYVVWHYMQWKAAQPTAEADAPPSAGYTPPDAVLVYLAWVPARSHSTPVVSAATTAWEWVMSAVPPARVALLSEVSSAWAWCLAQGWGLFSGDQWRRSLSLVQSFDAADAETVTGEQAVGRIDAPASEASDEDPPLGEELYTPPSATVLGGGISEAQAYRHLSGSAESPTPAHLVSTEPHRLWLGFWARCWGACLGSSVGEATLVAQAVATAVREPAALSTHPAAMGTRIRLQHLALTVLHSMHHPRFANAAPSIRDLPGASGLLNIAAAARLEAAAGMAHSGPQTGLQQQDAELASICSGAAWSTSAANAAPKQPYLSADDSDRDLGRTGSFKGHSTSMHLHLNASRRTALPPHLRFAVPEQADVHQVALASSRLHGEGTAILPTLGGVGASNGPLAGVDAALAAYGTAPLPAEQFTSGGSPTRQASFLMSDAGGRRGVPSFAMSPSAGVLRYSMVPFAAGQSDAGDGGAGNAPRVPEPAAYIGAARASTRPVRNASWLVLGVGSLALFRSRIVACSLGVFQERPSWYEGVTGPERLRSDWPYFVSFMQLLSADRAFWYSSAVPQRRTVEAAAPAAAMAGIAAAAPSAMPSLLGRSSGAGGTQGGSLGRGGSKSRPPMPWLQGADGAIRAVRSDTAGSLLVSSPQGSVTPPVSPWIGGGRPPLLGGWTSPPTSPPAASFSPMYAPRLNSGVVAETAQLSMGVSSLAVRQALLMPGAAGAADAVRCMLSAAAAGTKNPVSARGDSPDLCVSLRGPYSGLPAIRGQGAGGMASPGSVLTAAGTGTGSDFDGAVSVVSDGNASYDGLAGSDEGSAAQDPLTALALALAEADRTEARDRDYATLYAAAHTAYTRHLSTTMDDSNAARPTALPVTAGALSSSAARKAPSLLKHCRALLEAHPVREASHTRVRAPSGGVSVASGESESTTGGTSVLLTGGFGVAASNTASALPTKTLSRDALHTARSSSGGTVLGDAPLQHTVGETFPGQHALSDLASRSALLLLLMASEADRMVAWHNPLGLIHRRLPNEDMVSLHVYARARGIDGTPRTVGESALRGSESGGEAASAGGRHSGGLDMQRPNADKPMGSALTAASVSDKSGSGSGTAGHTGPNDPWHPDTAARRCTNNVGWGTPQLSCTALSYGLQGGMWHAHVLAAWRMDPALALALGQRFPAVSAVTSALRECVVAQPALACRHALAAQYAITHNTVRSESPVLLWLHSWAPAAPSQIMRFLARVAPEGSMAAPLASHPRVMQYCVKCLRRYSPSTIVFYLPQLVQALRHDGSGALSEFLLQTAIVSVLVAHQLMWQLVTESKQDTHGAGKEADGPKHGFQGQVPGRDMLPDRATALFNKVQSAFPPLAKAMFRVQYDFWDAITDISGRLKREVPSKADRSAKIKVFLKDLAGQARADVHEYISKLAGTAKAHKADGAGQGAADTAAGEGGSSAQSGAAAGSEQAAHTPQDYIALRSESKLAGAAVCLRVGVSDILTKEYAARRTLQSLDNPPTGSAADGSAAGMGKETSEIEQAIGQAASGRSTADSAFSSSTQGMGATPSVVRRELAAVLRDSVIYLPTAPSFRLQSVKFDSGRALQSAAKCPFFLSFTVTPFAGPDAAFAAQQAAINGQVAEAGVVTRGTVVTRGQTGKSRDSHGVWKRTREQLASNYRRLRGRQRQQAGADTSSAAGLPHGVHTFEDSDEEVLMFLQAEEGGAEGGGKRESMVLVVPDTEEGSVGADYDQSDLVIPSSHTPSRKAGLRWNLARVGRASDHARAKLAVQSARISSKFARSKLSIKRAFKKRAVGLSSRVWQAVTPSHGTAGGEPATIVSDGGSYLHMPEDGPKHAGDTLEDGVDLAGLEEDDDAAEDDAEFDLSSLSSFSASVDTHGDEEEGGLEEHGENESKATGSSAQQGGAAAGSVVAASDAGSVVLDDDSIHASVSGGPTRSISSRMRAVLSSAKKSTKRIRIKRFRLRRRRPAAGGAAGTQQIAMLPRAVQSPAGGRLRAAASRTRAVIFKVYDDIRQDALALQVVQVLKTAFAATATGLTLFPYRVVPSRVGTGKDAGGLLEVVPNSRSMDDIGKSGSPSLYHYFVNRYGRPGSPAFVAAQRNFARSSAAYAVACLLLWIKDRHNGNILVNADGHFIHIDFGFLLGISPGGNLGFETASFKLTQEMVDILGGVGAEPYLYFQELACRGMLLAHQQAATIDTLVSGMADSGLECYHFDTTLQFLRQRQRWSDTPIEVAAFMAGRVQDAENNGNTLMYDGIQKAQNNIHSQRWQ